MTTKRGWRSSLHLERALPEGGMPGRQLPPAAPVPREGRRKEKRWHCPSEGLGDGLDVLGVQAGQTGVKAACGGSPWTPGGRRAMHELQPSQTPPRVKLSKCRLKIRKSFLAGRCAERGSGKQCGLGHAAVSSGCTGTAAAEHSQCAVPGLFKPRHAVSASITRL